MNTVRKGILYLLTFIVFLSVTVSAETNINGYEAGLMSKIYGHFGIMTYRHGFFNKAHNVTEVEATFPVYRIATHSHPENPIGKPLDYAVEYSEYAVIAKVIKKERLEKDVDFQKNPVKYFCIELEIQDVIYGEITDQGKKTKL